MLNICITFDYELWLDEIIPEEEDHLFMATDDLLEMLRVEGVSTTFFVDTCSVQAHKRYNQLDYVNRFEEQIKKAARDGHDIELHLHPSWYRCRYDDYTNRWQMTYDGYFVQDYGFGEGQEISAQAIIRENKEYLEKLIRSVDLNYQCIAYRAGGFGICPERELCRTLRNEGIWIDSSVALEQMDRVDYRYDFRCYPKKISWWFEAGGNIREASERGESSIHEIAIGFGKNNLFKYCGIPMKELRVQYQQRADRLPIKTNSQSKMMQKLHSLKRHFAGKGILSLDTRGNKLLMRDLRENYQRYRCDEQDASLAIICHPKMASRNTIENMKRFIRQVRDAKEDYRFITIAQAGQKGS